MVRCPLPRSPAAFTGALLALLSAQPALAHRNYFDSTFETGSGSLAQESLAGQYGFSPNSPFFVRFEADHQAFYLSPDENGYRALGEAGYESTHLGFSVRGGYFSGGLESLDYTQFGATLAYRFVSWDLLTSDEDLFLKHEDRRDLHQRRRREIAAQIPKAPLLTLSYDELALSSSLAPPSSQLSSVQASRFGLGLQATVSPYFMLAPKLEFYGYSTAPGASAAVAPSYGSHALRLIQLGPEGRYSGIYGCPSDVQQLYVEVKIFPLLTVDAALTRASLVAPSSTAYSAWVGFDRFITDSKLWAISPGYEQVLMAGQSLSYFMVSLRMGAGGRYLPKAF